MFNLIDGDGCTDVDSAGFFYSWPPLKLTQPQDAWARTVGPLRRTSTGSCGPKHNRLFEAAAAAVMQRREYEIAVDLSAGKAEDHCLASTSRTRRLDQR